MIRRRRPQREAVFSFDSFLDLVTNVVGIIIRLILVVWVGARSYTGFKDLGETAPEATTAAALPDPVIAPDDPLQQELARQRAELEAAQKRLLEQLRQLELVEATGKDVLKEMDALGVRKQELDQLRAEMDGLVSGQARTGQAMVLTLADLQKRRERIKVELVALEKLPPLKKVLRYRTPVSRPVHAEEYHFECKNGRVAFVDVTTMLNDIRRDMKANGERLKNDWQVSDVTGAVGAFRLRYVLERQRDGLDAAFGTMGPATSQNFGYALSKWVVEPVLPQRGEALDTAMAATSEFRHVADGLSPALAAVTFWVYPDSFGIYRQLRDYLADRDITVAGRPLPEGIPITCSRNGSVSRGQ